MDLERHLSKSIRAFPRTGEYYSQDIARKSRLKNYYFYFVVKAWSFWSWWINSSAIIALTKCEYVAFKILNANRPGFIPKKH